VRVLHVTSSFPRHAGDAVGPYLADLVGLQARAGIDVAVVAPHAAGLAVREGNVHRFRYAPAPAEVLAYRGGMARAARRPLGAVLVVPFVVAMAAAATTAARRQRPDVIHAHWWLPAGLAALVASRLTGVPYVVTLHGSDVHLARHALIRPLARAVLRRAARVLAVSRALATEAESVLRLAPGTVGLGRMPVIVLEDLENKAAPAPAPPPLRLFAAGRLSPEKGFDVLMAAVGELGRDVVVEVAGDGPERAALRAAAPATVRFLGEVPRAEVHARMAAAHAVVVPSRREALGIVAAEALALGVPVVASRVGGLAELVRDGDGLLVPPGDPAALAAALRCLPLPPTTGAALDAHRAGAVVDAHRAVYEAAAGAVGRWRPLRWLGLVTALAVLGVLVRIAVDDWAAIRRAWAHPRLGPLVLAVVAAAVAEGGFGLASAGSLRASRVAGAGDVGTARAASAFWAAQAAKNLPGGLWPAVARSGISARFGLDLTATLRWMATEAAGSCVAGAVLGAAALAAAGRPAPLPRAVWVLIAAGTLASPALLGGVSRWRRAASVTPRPDEAWRSAAAYVPVWSVVAVAFAALTASVTRLGAHALVVAGAAACVAGVAGFVAVPIPAGVGVREAVLVALLSGSVPTGVAVSVALGARILSLIVQAALAAVGVVGSRRAGAAQPRPTSR